MAESSPPPQASLSSPITTSIPQKRPLEDEHAPSVSSPLNPDPSTSRSKPPATTPAVKEKVPMYREPREKKESLKKREAKAGDVTSTAAVKGGTPDRGTTSTSNASNAQASSSSKLLSSSSAVKPLPITAPLRYKLPPPKPLDYALPKPPVLTPHHIQRCNGTDVQFYESSEHVYNRKGFRYTHCIADPLFPSTLHYRQSDTPPFTPRINHEDTSSHLLFTPSATQITTQKGFRMARANVGVREGTWYWECRITSGIPPVSSPSQEPNGHVRIGFARREAPLDAPVGFDAYSYGLRDVGFQKIHMSRPSDFLSPPATDPPSEPIDLNLREGDVLGLLISLPPLSLHRKIVTGDFNPAVDLLPSSTPPDPSPDIIRDRVPIHYKSHLYFESYEYHPTKDLEELTHPSPLPSTSSSLPPHPPNPTHPSVPLRTLPGSYIKIYRNGKPVGTPFENLLAFLPPASKPQSQGVPPAREGLDDSMVGYFPSISVFRGGAAEANFGPEWWCPPEDEKAGAQDGDGDVAMGEGESDGRGEQKRPMAERYNEQIAEDIVCDVIDEVDFFLQDGGSVPPASVVGHVAATATVATERRDGKTVVGGEVASALEDVAPVSAPTASVDAPAPAPAPAPAVADADPDLPMPDAVPTLAPPVEPPHLSVPSTDTETGATEEIKEIVQEDE